MKSGFEKIMFCEVLVRLSTDSHWLAALQMDEKFDCSQEATHPSFALGSEFVKLV